MSRMCWRHNVVRGRDRKRKTSPRRRRRNVNQTPAEVSTSPTVARCVESLLGDSSGVVNSLDFCPASFKSLGCFYFRCVLSSQWKAVKVNL